MIIPIPKSVQKIMLILEPDLKKFGRDSHLDFPVVAPLSTTDYFVEPSVFMDFSSFTLEDSTSLLGALDLLCFGFSSGAGA